jgi:hypothetical protein
MSVATKLYTIERKKKNGEVPVYLRITNMLL